MTFFRFCTAALLALSLTGCATIHDLALLTLSTGPSSSEPFRFRSHGTPVYSNDECIGPVIMGECHGSILSTNPNPVRCYGAMLNGQCTGPMF